MKYEINGKLYDPVKYGDKGDWGENETEESLCGDCGAKEGEYHLDGCDIERCPVCYGQLISCGCGEVYCIDDDKTAKKTETELI